MPSSVFVITLTKFFFLFRITLYVSVVFVITITKFCFCLGISVVFVIVVMFKVLETGVDLSVISCTSKYIPT